MIDSSLFPVITSAMVFIVVVLGIGPLGWVWDKLSQWYTSDLLKLLEVLEISQQSFNFYMRIWGIALVVGLVLMLVVFQLPLLAVAVTVIVAVSYTHLTLPTKA